MLALVKQQPNSDRTEIWNFSHMSSPEKRIAAQLVVMAEMRQATVTMATVTLYSKRLSVAPLELVERALVEIGESSVEKFETRFPETGKILVLMRRYESDRCNYFQKLPDGTFGSSKQENSDSTMEHFKEKHDVGNDPRQHSRPRRKRKSEQIRSHYPAPARNLW